MSNFYDKYDYTPNYTKETIVNESHSIPSEPPYRLYLRHIPRQQDPSTVSIPGFTETTTAPSQGEFRVRYTEALGALEFHSDDAGSSITVGYNACGTVVWAESYPDGRAGINKVQEEVDKRVEREGDEMSGGLKAKSTGYEVFQVRNIYISTDDPDDALGENGDIWIKYEEG